MERITSDGNGGTRINLPLIKPGSAKKRITVAVFITISLTVAGWVYGYAVSKTRTEVKQNELIEAVNDHETRMRAVESCVVRMDTNIENINKNIEKISDRMDDEK